MTRMSKMMKEDLHMDENGIIFCNSSVYCSECDNKDCLFAIHTPGKLNRKAKPYEWTQEKYERELAHIRGE